MEFWWWIEPLFYTAVIAAALATLIAYIAFDIFQTDNKIVEWVIGILLAPLALAVLSSIVWLLCCAMYSIWAPYLLKG